MHSAEARHELNQNKPFRLALSPDWQIRNTPRSHQASPHQITDYLEDPLEFGR